MKNFVYKVKYIFLNIIPILVMVVLIPVIKDDYILTGVYIFISGVAFAVKYEKREWMVYVFGFFAMIFFEYIFISTGVEIFNCNSLLGLMPIWLPFLWAYGFVAIKRSVKILEE